MAETYLLFVAIIWRQLSYIDEELPHGPPYDLELVCNYNHEDSEIDF